jgi:hypothetical protein
MLAKVPISLDSEVWVGRDKQCGNASSGERRKSLL